jgi:hypothetical protein
MDTEDKARFDAIHRELAEEALTKDQVLNYAFRKFMRRISDKEYDAYDKKRFQEMTEKEVEEQLRQDILDGLPP